MVLEAQDLDMGHHKEAEKPVEFLAISQGVETKISQRSQVLRVKYAVRKETDKPTWHLEQYLFKAFATKSKKLKN